VSEDATNRTQNLPSPRLGRKYIRRLLEAFEPQQDALFADLDRQIEESNPDIVSREMDELSRQWWKKMKQLEQLEKVESGIDEAALIALVEELTASIGTQMTLWKQLKSTARQNDVLQYKRAYLVELLQAIQTIRQEGQWENIGENEKCPSEWVILGERFITFEFTKQQLRFQTIGDIHEWMKQHRPDFLPAEEEPEEQVSTTKKPAKPTQRKRPVVTEEPLPSASPAQIYERQGWVKIIGENLASSSMIRLRASHEPCFICGHMAQNRNFPSWKAPSASRKR
jgi:hypothetical protein